MYTKRGVQETRGVVQEDKTFLPRRVRLEFPPSFQWDKFLRLGLWGQPIFWFPSNFFSPKVLNGLLSYEREALVWYQDAVDRALLTRFGPTSYDNPMEALARLRQTNSVAAYKAQFKGLLNRLKRLYEKHKLSCFLSGLKDKIRLPVCMLI